MTLQNLELKGKEVRFSWIKPFDTIADYASRSAWLRRLYPVRTFFVKEVMGIDLAYINAVLINEQAKITLKNHRNIKSI